MARRVLQRYQKRDSSWKFCLWLTKGDEERTLGALPFKGQVMKRGHEGE